MRLYPWSLLALAACEPGPDTGEDSGGESDSDTVADSEDTGDTEDTGVIEDTEDTVPACPGWEAFPEAGVVLADVDPEGLAFGPDCALYVAAGAVVQRIAPEDGFVPSVFASDPTMTDLQGLTWGPDDHLYVASRGADAIGRFDAAGAFVDVFAVGGFELPNTPRFAEDGSLWVSSRNTGELVRFDASGSLLGAAVSDPLLGSPEGFTFTPDGDVVVAWRGNHEVWRYALPEGSPDRRLLSSAQVDSPENLVYDAAGDLWVASRDSREVLRLSGADDSVLERLPMPGLGEPTGLAISPDGLLFAALQVDGVLARVR